MLAAVLVRVPGFAQRMRGMAPALAAIGALALLVALCDTAYGGLPWALLTFAFVVISCGNDLFGLLTLHSTRMLGRMAYSVYLLHGIVLYTAFMLVIGSGRVAAWSAATFWVAMADAPFS